MINLIIFGPPGSGKGTQALNLIKKYKLVHISTGDLFRYNLKNNTKLGKEAKKYIDKGELVPDTVTIKMLQAKVKESGKVKGFIFDGFPRTIPQCKALDRFLKKSGHNVSKLLMLDVPDQELISRLLERGKTSGRADDLDPAIIGNRLNVYKETTFPVFDYYQALGKAVKVWGVGSLEIIFKRLGLEIDDLLKKSSQSKVSKKKSTTKKRIRKAIAPPKSKSAAKREAAKKTAAKKTAAKKTVAKKTAAKKTAAKKATSKKSSTKKTSSKKITAKKTTTGKTTSAKKPARKKITTKKSTSRKSSTAKKPSAKKVNTKKATSRKPSSTRSISRSTTTKKTNKKK